MTWCRQATSHYLDQCLAKFVCHYLGANELIYSQTVAELTDFYLVVCMASNLIFRKQRFGSTSVIHLSIRRDSVESLSHQRWSGVFVARVIALHWPRLRSPVSPLCFADHAVKQSVMHASGFAAARATPGSQWHKRMLGQSHHCTVRDMTVFRPTHSGRCSVQINIGHFESHGEPCDRPYYTTTNAGWSVCLSVWIDLFKGLILSWAPKPVSLTG